MNSFADEALLQLIYQNVHSLENERKNWSEELKEVKERVQQQLQIFDLDFRDIKQRVLKLETGHQRLKSGQQRLKTGHQRLETEQQRLKTGHQRLETRMTQFEGTLTFKFYDYHYR